jgi:hypothetical protein
LDLRHQILVYLIVSKKLTPSGKLCQLFFARICGFKFAQQIGELQSTAIKSLVQNFQSILSKPEKL